MGTPAPDLSGAQWYKSTASGDNGQCVEVATNLPGIVAMRDSKNPSGPALAFEPGAWSAFVKDAQAGKFDLV